MNQLLKRRIKKYYIIMIKKIALLLLVGFMLSCNSSKSVVKTTSKSKTTAKKPTTPVASKPKTGGGSEKEVTLEATSNVRTYDDEIRLYIDSFSEIAKNNMRTHGFASITLAQGILESGAGKGN